MVRSALAVASFSALILTAVPQAPAAEFTWSFQGEAQTLDPHAITEFQTMGFIGNFYEPLVRRNQELKLEPALAESWKLIGPTEWRFSLRKNVVFHDGTPFTADDVIFTLTRTRAESADAKSKVHSIKDIKKIDDHTIEITTHRPNPILLAEISDWFMMSKAWSEKHNATTPADVRKGAENYATRHENGTGPFRVVSREPDVRTVIEPFDKWWDKREHNLTKATFLPVGNAATRMAALLSGEVDLAYPVPTQDIARLKSGDKTYVIQGPEARVIFFGFDQKRDQLLYGSVKDKNPFKDVRVRKAFYQAIDVNAIVSKIMDGAATARGTVLSKPMVGFSADLDQRFPYDPAAAKKLLAEAGYPNGFSVTLDCPNDRYVNDEAVCVAAAGMLGRIGVNVNVAAISKTKYFGKALGRDTTFQMLGWGAHTLDGHNPLYDVHSTPKAGAEGRWNFGAYSNPEVDALTVQVANEVDEAKRAALMKKAYEIVKNDFAVIPLFETTLAWGARKGVTLAQRADERFELRWVRKN